MCSGFYCGTPRYTVMDIGDHNTYLCPDYGQPQLWTGFLCLALHLTWGDHNCSTDYSMVDHSYGHTVHNRILDLNWLQLWTYLFFKKIEIIIANLNHHLIDGSYNYMCANLHHDFPRFDERTTVSVDLPTIAKTDRKKSSNFQLCP